MKHGAPQTPAPAGHAERIAAAAEAAAACPPPDTLTPADRYAELFVDVQSARIFPDSKTFVDCAPRRDPQLILADYRRDRSLGGFSLREFVAAQFSVPAPRHSDYVSPRNQPLREHIDSLWPVLTRHPRHHPERASLLPLAHDYVVPGGRFDELYYWDSYFTMLGLPCSGRSPLLHAMTDNFAYLIDTHGHVPNGTRTYYLSRSQPPVFALMVELCEQCGGAPMHTYLPQLLQEHAWWMDGAAQLRRGEAHRRAVRLPDGTLLNRYWDDRDTPREEAWLEDVQTAARSDRPAAEVYRDLRAAAESGWDFSSRWYLERDDDDDAPPDRHRPRIEPAERLADIATTRLLPVDLNAFLFKLEHKIAELSRGQGDAAAADHFERLAAQRREAIHRLMWDDAQAAFFDHDWQRGRRRGNLTAACVVPLFVGLATKAQARALASTVRARLLAPGGLATTEVVSDQQWDRPNGWAPLQWMAVRGFASCGDAALAREIGRRWLASVTEVYRRERKLVEKYALRQRPGERSCGGDGGEYPLQDGFGWTNGVVGWLLSERARWDGRPPPGQVGVAGIVKGEVD